MGRGGEAEGEVELVVFAEGAGVEAGVPEALGEVGGEAVEGEDEAGVDGLDEAEEVGEVGVIAEGEGGIGLVSVAAGGLEGPAGEDGFAEGGAVGGERFEAGGRGADEDFAAWGAVAG